jgi:uncharacterized protein YndB with AHSA1/START domain
MRNDLVVSKSIVINASLQKVWEALTQPSIIKEYLHGTETITDWKVGSEIIFQGEYQGHDYRDRGVLLENIPFAKISYSYWSGFSGLEDSPENYSTVSYTIKDKGDSQTELTWTQQGFATEEGYQHSEGGMDAFLGSIKSIVEK